MSLLFPTSWDGTGADSSAGISVASQGKKRKRPSSSHKEDDVDLKSVEINIEKLMKKMQAEDAKATKEKGKAQDDGRSGKGAGKAAEKGKAKGGQPAEKRITSNRPDGKLGATQNGNGKPGVGKNAPKFSQPPTSISNSRPSTINETEVKGGKNNKRKRRPSDAAEQPQEGASSSPGKGDASQTTKKHLDAPSQKKTKKSRQSEPVPSKASIPDINGDLKPGPAPPAAAPSGPAAKLTPMQAKMKKSLDGARFRWINEQLYTTSSEAAHQMMKEQPNLYHDYHAGFSSQVESWPAPPLDTLITLLSPLPKDRLIADLGSGPGSLARALVPKGRKVLSFDLVADDWVTEADFCERIPLPGVEGRACEGSVVDVAVCCLSLMGTNWVRGVREARRVLTTKGQLYIAEVTSRFTDVQAFTAVISSLGFKLSKQDDTNTHFMLFVFEKTPADALTEEQWAAVQEKAVGLLKPCEYKRR